MIDVSGRGTGILLTSIPILPVGLWIDQWPDDTDPFDVPGVDIAEVAMGLNGGLVRWLKAMPITYTLAVLPFSAADRALQLVWDSLRPAQTLTIGGLLPSVDNLQITLVYPQGIQLTLFDGTMTKGDPAPGLQSSGRLKTKIYEFAFGSIAGVR